jgi:hypothetical protein
VLFRSEELRRTLSEDAAFTERSLKIRPIHIDSTELWGIDLIWVSSTSIGSMLSSDDITTETINIVTQELKNQCIYPIVIKFDIDKGKVIESKNATLARVAYKTGIKRIPLVIFNYQNKKIIQTNVHIKKRYSYYRKFTPYEFDSPEKVMTALQKTEWKSRPYLINNRQLFSDGEWQELRKSFLKTWNKTPDENIKRLRVYLGDFTDKLRILRVRNYLNGDGFKPGIIEYAIVDKLKEELSHYFI